MSSPTLVKLKNEKKKEIRIDSVIRIFFLIKELYRIKIRLTKYKRCTKEELIKRMGIIRLPQTYLVGREVGLCLGTTLGLRNMVRLS